MGSRMKNAIGGSIHRIREFELEKVSLADEFDILQIVGEGWFGKILLVEHKATDTEMVLKALPKPYTALRDFYREFHYGLHLGAHKNIITTYDVSFETAGFYVFSQEYAPLGDLTSNVQDTGIGELHSKKVAKQLASALDHLHSRDLVHRDVKLDNILVFKSDFSRIKLCDFGETRRVGSAVPRRNEWLPYAPPEVLQVKPDHDYITLTSHDVWQFGIVIFVCLTGCLPWQKAASDDPRYQRFVTWHLSTMKIGRQPKLFKLISSKGQRLFKKYLEPRPEKRPAGLADLYKFMDDRWLSKIGIEKNNEQPVEEDGLCPSMYSFHSSPEEKNKLLFSLTQYGLETTVDRHAKKDRIRDWIQSSVIEEEDEDAEEGGDDTDEDLGIKDNQALPAGERMDRGPISERKISNGGLQRKISRTASMRSLRKIPEIYSPPIDPRIPLEQQKDKVKLQVEEKAKTVATPARIEIKNKLVQMNSLEESETSSLVSNESSASQSTINFEHFGIHNALPFQNIKVNQNRINVQTPQNHYMNTQEVPVRTNAQSQFTTNAQDGLNLRHISQAAQSQTNQVTRQTTLSSQENQVHNYYYVQDSPNPQSQYYSAQDKPNQQYNATQDNQSVAFRQTQESQVFRQNYNALQDARQTQYVDNQGGFRQNQDNQGVRQYAQDNQGVRQYAQFNPTQDNQGVRQYPQSQLQDNQAVRQYPQSQLQDNQGVRQYPQSQLQDTQAVRQFPHNPAQDNQVLRHNAPSQLQDKERPTLQSQNTRRNSNPQNGHASRFQNATPQETQRVKHEGKKSSKSKPRSPIPPKRIVREDKRFAAYGKSSSSNSNNSNEVSRK